MVCPLEEALTLCSGTSPRYVPAPFRKQLQSDLILALRRFKNSARWREFFREGKGKLSKEEAEACEGVDGSEGEDEGKENLEYANLDKGLD